jgi:hypothetical protein
MNFLSLRKFRTVAAALALIVAVAVPTMHAQYLTQDLAVVNVPFAFEVGSTEFAAGKYMLTSLRSGALQIRGNSNSGLVMSRHEIDNRPSAKSVALFHKANGKYFLAEVHTQGSSNYVACVKSSEESRARKADMALNATKSNGVEVATVEASR